MANGLTSPSRVGLVEGNSDNNELFLKKFSGEILQTFEESNVFKALHTIRTIESGKSAHAIPSLSKSIRCMTPWM